VSAKISASCSYISKPYSKVSLSHAFFTKQALRDVLGLGLLVGGKWNATSVKNMLQRRT